ncbi:MAG: hypothetical protein AAGA11_22830 [Pseudomonadota bacterium]
MAVLSFVPFTLFLFLAYNVMVFLGGMPEQLDNNLMSVTLPSGSEWQINVGDVLIIIGTVILFVELFKATRTSHSSIVDHVLSMMVFVAFLVEFIVVQAAGNSVFFILLMLSLVDVVAGFTVSIAAARRDFGINPDLR